ncbi:PDZ domain-containing protein [Stieleria varia]|uniref:PDZ domain (Also known as DHR or GLGF) n=1 Tax=Stieleria varia TaxID=2528005 RepID=A0A5C6BAH3_9BACT|nr:PDZ domain-containing protein [Stieleria varia]TWU07504.1 PDZ domain (Also known as DHR or GLGF) [Stieleria varia]
MKRFAALVAVAVAALLTSTQTAEAQYPANSWTFGMNVSLVQNGNQKGLSIRSVAPGSPAQQAGLQPGMVILSSNGMTFHNAYNDYQGVAILQNSVTAGGGGGGVPTAAVNFNGPAVHLQVVRPCGSVFQTTCYPASAGGGGGVPTAL